MKLQFFCVAALAPVQLACAAGDDPAPVYQIDVSLDPTGEQDGHELETDEGEVAPDALATPVPDESSGFDPESVVCESAIRPDPSWWTDEINAFSSRDAMTPPPEAPVVFTGSSSIRLWDTLATDMAPHAVVNNGFGGSHTNDSLFFYESTILPYDPKAIVFYAGENDLAQDNPGPVSPECSFNDFEAFVAALRGSGIDAPIFYVSMKPSPARFHLQAQMDQVNTWMAAYAEGTDGVTFIDVASSMLNENGEPRPELFSTDNLHMNEEGYVIWSEIIKPYLDAL